MMIKFNQKYRLDCDNEFIINTDKGGSYQLKHPFSSHPKESIRQTALEEERIAQDLLARAGISLEQAQEARFSHYERSFGGNPDLQNQTTSAVESGASQQEGRVWQQLSRNEDLDKIVLDTLIQINSGMRKLSPGKCQNVTALDRLLY